MTYHTCLYYCNTMRTTIYLDDHLAEQLRHAARRQGKSLSAFLADAGRAKLRAPAREAEPFELLTYGRQGPYPGLSLDRASELLVAEDRERYGSAE